MRWDGRKVGNTPGLLQPPVTCPWSRGGRARWGLVSSTLVAVALVALLPSALPSQSHRPTVLRESVTTGVPSSFVTVAPGYVPGPGVTTLGPVRSTDPISVDIGLAPSDSAGLSAELALVSTPGSPEFHQFLSPAEVADRFAPSTSTY